MTGRNLAAVLLDTLDDDAVAELAERLRPHLSAMRHDGRLLAPREAAARLGLHEKTVVRMAREGRLAGAVKVGKSWRFHADGLVPAPPARLAVPAPAPPRVRQSMPTDLKSVRAIRGKRCV